MSENTATLNRRFKRLDNAAADLVERAGVRFYGAIGGEAAGQDEKAAVDAGRANRWGEAIKKSLQVEVDVGRHLVGRDKTSQGR